MKYLVQYIIILVAFPYLTKAQDAVNERLVIPLSNPGERVTIEAGLVNGNITITPYDGNEVIIQATAPEEKRNTETTSNGMKKISMASFDVSAEEQDNEVEISTNSWQRKIHLEISTPKNTDLRVNTVHGKINVSGLNGKLEVSSVNGGINFKDIGGSIISNTVNGDIRGNFLSVTSGEPMSFVTLNGDVDITFPASIKALAKMKSERGDVYTDFDMKVERTKPKVEQRSDTYRVSIESWVTGTINGGGPEYTFKNMHGTIYLRKK